MKKQEALKIVTKLGFIPRAGKELFFLYKHKGRLITTTAVPKGKGEMHVENDFRQQLKVTRDQFISARKCPFGAEEYLRHLMAIKLIEEEEADTSKPSGV